ncbi:MAG: membrane dipeptidase, partial [Actinomycetota bacterium]
SATAARRGSRRRAVPGRRRAGRRAGRRRRAQRRSASARPPRARPCGRGADPTPDRFCAMVADLADRVGVEHVAVGTDCTRGWGDGYLLYLRSGRRTPGPGEELPRWPDWPAWFQGPADMPALRAGLEAVGFDAASADRVMGGNWLRLLDEVLAPA